VFPRRRGGWVSCRGTLTQRLEGRVAGLETPRRDATGEEETRSRWGVSDLFCSPPRCLASFRWKSLGGQVVKWRRVVGSPPCDASCSPFFSCLSSFLFRVLVSKSSDLPFHLPTDPYLYFLLGTSSVRSGIHGSDRFRSNELNVSRFFPLPLSSPL